MASEKADWSLPDLAKVILYSAASVRGVFVCNREDLKTMVSALETGGVKPVIDKVSLLDARTCAHRFQVFPFEKLQDAYDYMAKGQHFGKICIDL